VYLVIGILIAGSEGEGIDVFCEVTLLTSIVVFGTLKNVLPVGIGNLNDSATPMFQAISEYVTTVPFFEISNPIKNHLSISKSLPSNQVIILGM
jgi:hypothetical protein